MAKLDQFGLPTFTLLGETDGERTERIRLVHDFIRTAFDAAYFHLGESEAQKAWAAVRIRKRGRKPKKHLKPEQASFLIALYDGLAAEQPHALPTIPRQIGEMLEKNARGKFGTDVKSIEKMMRRLLAERERRVQKEQESYNLMRRMIGELAASLDQGHN